MNANYHADIARFAAGKMREARKDCDVREYDHWYLTQIKARNALRAKGWTEQMLASLCQPDDRS